MFSLMSLLWVFRSVGLLASPLQNICHHRHPTSASDWITIRTGGGLIVSTRCILKPSVNRVLVRTYPYQNKRNIWKRNNKNEQDLSFASTDQAMRVKAGDKLRPHLWRYCICGAPAAGRLWGRGIVPPLWSALCSYTPQARSLSASAAHNSASLSKRLPAAHFNHKQEGNSYRMLPFSWTKPSLVKQKMHFIIKCVTFQDLQRHHQLLVWRTCQGPCLPGSTLPPSVRKVKTQWVIWYTVKLGLG